MPSQGTVGIVVYYGHTITYNMHEHNAVKSYSKCLEFGTLASKQFCMYLFSQFLFIYLQ